MKSLGRNTSLILLLAVLPLTGCLFRSHKVQPPAISTAALQTATTEQLIARINNEARAMKTLNATVDIASSVGGVKIGKVTEYQEIRGYILVRQPDMLRMIGLMPVVRTRAFDMVSNGREFKLFVPPKNRFYVGDNDEVAPGGTGLTAMRPQVIYDALLLNDINGGDIAVLEGGTQNIIDPKSHKLLTQADYRLDVVRRGPKGWVLARKIHFNRVDLQPIEQVIYDDQGNVASDVRYSNWKQHNDIWFPDVIQIWRPTEEYEITIGIVKLVLNQPLTDQQFVLTQPPGAQVVRLNGVRTQTANDGTK